MTLSMDTGFRRYDGLAGGGIETFTAHPRYPVFVDDGQRSMGTGFRRYDGLAGGGTETFTAHPPASGICR